MKPLSTGRTATLECRGVPGLTFTVEASSDLVHWTVVSARCTEIAPGQFRVSLPGASESMRFFRLRSGAGSGSAATR
jgi:hypothetical protein